MNSCLGHCYYPFGRPVSFLIVATCVASHRAKPALYMCSKGLCECKGHHKPNHNYSLKNVHSFEVLHLPTVKANDNPVFNRILIFGSFGAMMHSCTRVSFLLHYLLSLLPSSIYIFSTCTFIKNNSDISVSLRCVLRHE